MTNTEWDEFAKAEWILKNGSPKVVYIFERANGMVYQRPRMAPEDNIPPWINTQRTPLETNNTNGDTDGSEN